MIRLALQGPAGQRIGTVTIDAETWRIEAWHRHDDGFATARTLDGQIVTYATDRGRGGITIGDRSWLIAGMRGRIAF